MIIGDVPFEDVSFEDVSIEDVSLFVLASFETILLLLSSKRSSIEDELRLFLLRKSGLGPVLPDAVGTWCWVKSFCVGSVI